LVLYISEDEDIIGCDIQAYFYTPTLGGHFILVGPLLLRGTVPT